MVVGVFPGVRGQGADSCNYDDDVDPGVDDDGGDDNGGDDDGDDDNDDDRDDDGGTVPASKRIGGRWLSGPGFTAEPGSSFYLWHFKLFFSVFLFSFLE